MPWLDAVYVWTFACAEDIVPNDIERHADELAIEDAVDGNLNTL